MRGQSPGALSGKPPTDFGTGRRCACGAKMGRYTTGSVCNLCHDNPSRLEAAEKITTEAEMFGGNKWKSAQYPDGCSACPEDERLKRKHAARGLCSKCYYAERRAGEVADRIAKAEATEAGRANLSLVPERDDDGVPTVDRLLSSQAGVRGPDGPVAPAGPKGPDGVKIPPDDNHESDRAGSFHVKENGMPGFVCERLPEWASEIIQDPEGIDAIERAELGEDVDADVPLNQIIADSAPGDIDIIEAAWGLIANASEGDWNKATPEWRDAAERWRDDLWHPRIGVKVQDPITDPACQPCCVDFADCDRPCTPRGRWQRDRELRADAEASCSEEPLTTHVENVINVATGPGIYMPGGIDGELCAMEEVRRALESLEEAARLRVVKWACDRFQIIEG